MQKKTFTILSAILVALLAGCSKSDDQSTQTVPTEVPAASVAPAAPATNDATMPQQPATVAPEATAPAVAPAPAPAATDATASVAAPATVTPAPAAAAPAVDASTEKAAN